jgi:adenine deaminase
LADSVESRALIEVAAGRREADLVLSGGRVVNVVSHEVLDCDVAILGDRIAGLGAYRGRRRIDLHGRYLCPGLIDAHVHIESSLLSVQEFARVICARGTVAVVADPHEFANVLGTEGISFVLRNAKQAPVDVFVMLSSARDRRRRAHRRRPLAFPLKSLGPRFGGDDELPRRDRR